MSDDTYPGDSGRCPKCDGQGIRSVYLDHLGGSVECDLCDGTGEVTLE